jgi:hypothetical protein
MGKIPRDLFHGIVAKVAEGECRLGVFVKHGYWAGLDGFSERGVIT